MFCYCRRHDLHNNIPQSVSGLKRPSEPLQRMCMADICNVQQLCPTVQAILFHYFSLEARHCLTCSSCLSDSARPMIARSTVSNSFPLTNPSRSVSYSLNATAADSRLHLLKSCHHRRICSKQRKENMMFMHKGVPHILPCHPLCTAGQAS